MAENYPTRCSYFEKCKKAGMSKSKMSNFLWQITEQAKRYENKLSQNPQRIDMQVFQALEKCTEAIREFKAHGIKPIRLKPGAGF